MTGIIIIAVLVLLVLFVAMVYNKMVANKNRTLEAWSGVDVFLKKRYDVIPNLVETVKGYATHEKSTFDDITRHRAEAMGAKSPEEKIESENKLGQSLMNLFAVAENYPELKANSNFMQLQQQLVDLENDIEKSRRYYNGTVRENNTYIESFPSNIIAGLFKFEKKPFFEISNAEKETPRVSF